MAATMSVTISRDSLGLSPLTISDDMAAGPYLFSTDGLGNVVIEPEYSFAPNAADVDGAEPVSMRKKETELPLDFYVMALSPAALQSAVDDITQACLQDFYEVSRTSRGVTRTWMGAACAVRPFFGAVDSGMEAIHLERLTATIPFFNPNFS